MIRLAVVGCGGMANGHVNGFKKIPGVRITACCDVAEDRAAQFARKHGIPASYTDLGGMLASEKLDAVTNVTSDAAHASTSIAAFKAGLHVLCEKPLATSLAEANKMVRAAQKSGRIHMVNFSYRNSPALQRAREIVQAGKLGRITHVEASYLQSWICSRVWGDWKDNWAWIWRLSTQAGSAGTLGDIGCHIIDFATFVAGGIRSLSCQLSRLPKGVPGERWQGLKLDANDNVAITAEFEGGVLGCIHTTRWASGHANSLRLRVFGDQGAVDVDLDKGWDTLQVCIGRKAVDKCAWTTLKCRKTPSNLERFIRSIRTGKNEQPDFVRGAEIQAYLDACFRSAKSKKLARIASAGA